MPRIQLIKRIVDGGRFVRPGEVINVGPQRAAQLIRRQIGVEVFTPPATEKTAPAEKSNDPAAADPTPTPPDGSPTGRAITSASLVPARARTKRRSTRRKAKSEE